MKIQFQVGTVQGRTRPLGVIVMDGSAPPVRKGRRPARPEVIRDLEIGFEPQFGPTVFVRVPSGEILQASSNGPIRVEHVETERLFIGGELPEQVESLRVTYALNGRPRVTSKVIAGSLSPAHASVFTDVPPGPARERPFADREFIGHGLARGKDHCVLDVLRLLVEDEGNVLWIAQYDAAGVRLRDSNVIESPVRTIRVLHYQSRRERFNFSLLCLKDIKVRTKRGRILDRKEWHAYHVVRDGQIQPTKLLASLSRHSWNVLRDARVIAWDDRYDPVKRYELDMSRLPVVSRSWADPKTLRLVELLREERELLTEARIVRKRLKDMLKEQPELVHTLPKGNGSIHRPRGVKEAPTNSYSVLCHDIRLVKYKPAAYDHAGMSFLDLYRRLEAVKRRLKAVRFIIRCVFLAMEQYRSNAIEWDTGRTVTRGSRKIEKREQSALFEGARLKRVTWTEMFSC